MSEIWTNLLLPKALKSCPKSNKSPNLVTLDMRVGMEKVSKDILLLALLCWRKSVLHRVRSLARFLQEFDAKEI